MVKESDKQTQNKLQAFCKHIKREALIYKASRNFHTIQTQSFPVAYWSGRRIRG